MLVKAADILHHRLISQTCKFSASSKLLVCTRHDVYAVNSLQVPRKSFEKAWLAATSSSHIPCRNFAPHKVGVTGIHENISALQTKKRVARRRDLPGTDGVSDALE